MNKLMIEGISDKLKQQLEEIGIYGIEDMSVLYNSSQLTFKEIHLLRDLINEKSIRDYHFKQIIVRTLNVKEASGIANQALINEYNRTSKDKELYRWVIGDTIATIATPDDLDNIIEIIKNKGNGMSRQMFVIALSNYDKELVEDFLLSLVEEEEIAPHAITTLGKIKSQKAKKVLKKLTEHKRGLIRQNARKALKRIN